MQIKPIYPLIDNQAFKSYNIPVAEVAQLVEQRTENPRVISSILILGTILKRKWLSGRASPCQGEGREFESRLPLHLDMSRSGGMVDAAVSKTVEGQPSCRFESDLRHYKETTRQY